MKRIDLVGQKFSRLTVIEPIGFIKHHFRWKCICDCGKETITSSQDLRKGRSKSCGCYMIDRIKEVNSSQGGNSRNENRSTYYAWVSMRGRCYNVNHPAYKHYGGRGIGVCDRWLGKDGFNNFLEDMGRKPSPELSLDRYPNNDTGWYEKSNCRWATDKQQQQNIRSNKWYEHDGRRMIRSDWCKELGVSDGAFRYKMRNTKKSFTEIFNEFKPSTNLKEDLVLKIFNSVGTIREISEKYKVSYGIVKDIKCGWTWSTVTGKEYIRKRV